MMNYFFGGLKPATAKGVFSAEADGPNSLDFAVCAAKEFYIDTT
jgi:hypothetical protein